MQQRYFLLLIFGFVAGIAFRSFFDFGWSFVLWVTLLGLTFMAFGFREPKCTKWCNRGGKFLFAGFFFAAVGLGMLRFSMADVSGEDFALDAYVGRGISIEGIVVDEPDKRENNVRIVVEPVEQSDEVADAASNISFGVSGTKYGKVLATVDQYPEFSYGDRVRIEGVLKLPQNFETDSGRVFNYVSYLDKDGIRYQMFYPHTELLGGGEGNVVKEKLFALKHAFLDRVGQLIPEPHSSLLGGLVVGAKEALGKDLLDDFRATGIIHIVVLSGYNVTIVAEALMQFFGAFVPRALAMSFGALAIIGFAIMVGGGATIVRASLMALLVIAARATGRSKEITIALLVAGFLMLLHNPKILVFDPSFQLSFMATLGLIYLAPLIEQHFKLVPSAWGLREFATATIATQIFVLPLLIYMMGELSLVSLPVNMLVLVVIPATMLFGFLAGAAGFLSLALAAPFAFLAYLLLAYELKVVELFAALPFASIAVPQISFWVLVLVYALYAWLIYRWQERYKDTVDDAKEHVSYHTTQNETQKLFDSF